ncbi:MAG: DUF333 domain-containing protein [Paenirhodobacter sp.]|uniref:putative hemolysin n=1 Tax=Paenirhodobacter sp. TaxID=1965326 RepID=UPI003D12B061
MARVILLAGLIPLAACAAPENAAPGLANPASQHCVALGGTLEIRTAADGGESGWCHLPDGRVIEEWALFRADFPAPKP